MQVSDIHFGQATQSQDKHIHKEVRRALAEDLRSFPADAIVVTGDVAYSGQEAEYKEAAQWLEHHGYLAHAETAAVEKQAAEART